MGQGMDGSNGAAPGASGLPGSTPTRSTRGVITSLGSSIFFGAIYFVTPKLAPLSAEAVWALRMIVTMPFVAAVIALMGGWGMISKIGRRIVANPWLLLGIFMCGALMSAQLWVFTWAPMHGRGMQVALGYFLLPLVLVLTGRLLYGERLTRWQLVAALVAAVGVAYEIVRVGGISWETLLVALGYTAYFVLRRTIRTAHMGGMWWELATVFPILLTVFVLQVKDTDAFETHPALWWIAPGFALWTAFALFLYVLASKLLTMSVFGLLSYVEPALLVVASLLIGERIDSSEWFTYAAIWLAVLILMIGGLVDLRRPQPPPNTGAVPPA